MTTAPIKCLHSAVWPIDRFLPHPRNPNTHPESQLVLLADIIRVHGWRNPIVVSTLSGFVIKGHGRLAAARLAGLTECPVELQDYDSEAREIADMVADNRIAELSEADPFTLHGLLSELKTDPEFDMLRTGFTAEEFAALEADLTPPDSLSDGITRTERKGRQKGLADTVFKCGPISFVIERESFLKWLESLRQTVGFNKNLLKAEIRRRLAL
jgi:hypothetical protein